MWRTAVAFVIGLIVISAVSMASAQSEECLAVAQAAFEALRTGCATSESSSACFGMATSVDPPAPNFASTGDAIRLQDVTAVTTNDLELDTVAWGMARLNVPANVPLTVSETGVIFLLIGDATIENMVSPENAFAPVAPVRLQALVGANLRSIPSTDGRVISSAPAGAELAANGMSADGAWAYVTYDDAVAWVSLQIVVPTEGELQTLPVVTNESRSLMQDFVLRTGTEPSVCSEQPPSMLVIQAPDGITSLVTINGADIRFTGSVVLRTLADNSLQLFVLDGSASNGIVSVPPGFAVFAPLDSSGRSVDGPWAGLRPITGAERGWLSILGQVPVTTLYSSLSVPSNDEVAATLRSVNQAAADTAQTVSTGSSGGNCNGLRPTSPLDGLAFGPTTFYWDGVPNATGYRVNVYTDGELARSETIDALSTTTTFDTATSAIGDGLSYSWNVDALVDGSVTCSSGTVTLLRQAAPQRASGGSGGSDDGDGNNCGWGGC